MDKRTPPINFINNSWCLSLSMCFTFFVNISCVPLLNPMDTFIFFAFAFILLAKFQNSMTLIDHIPFVNI